MHRNIHIIAILLGIGIVLLFGIDFAERRWYANAAFAFILSYAIVIAGAYIINPSLRKQYRRETPPAKVKEIAWWRKAFYSIYLPLVFLAALIFLVSIFHLPIIIVFIVYAFWLLAVIVAEIRDFIKRK